MILIIDNYDSFTYNLFQYIGEITKGIEVFRNDKITLDEIERKEPSHIVISPGPCYPKDAGISIEVVKRFSGKIPILGVCLGHQSIGEAFGGKTVHAKELMHGKASEIKIDNQCAIFRGLPEIISAGRYHSLVVDRDTLPDCLEITAFSNEGEIMALKHREFNVFGIQFHPESILTPDGKTILKNFIDVKGGV